MSTFEVKVLPVKIEVHPNADALEVARVGDYRCIVRKGDFGNGDMVAYIPEGAIVPQELVAEMGLTGRLAGPEQNRVKAVKLRGVLSQGLVYPARKGWRQGMDVAPELGIWKYEPVVPAGFSGELMSVSGQRTLNYDIENIKKLPDVFQDGDQVIFTEKLHGTFAMFGIMGDDNLVQGEQGESVRLVIGSKGIAAKGLAFRVPTDEMHPNWNNIYCKTARHFDILSSVEEVFGLGRTVFILGEIFGPGVQDLDYGLKAPGFRIFDIYIGNPGQGRFLNDIELDQKCLELDIARVPVLYRGPFSKEVLDLWTNGKETLGGGRHVREGVVVRPVVEHKSGFDLPCGDRAQLKSVSEGYLLRKGNVTEFT